MKLILRPRAEVALRSLSKVEQKSINQALNKLSSASPDELRKNPNLHRLKAAYGPNLYAFRGSHRLRLILTFDADSCIVEDIVDHDKLERYRLIGGQK